MINKGLISVFKEEKFVPDNTRKYFVFDVVPMGAVRMTQSDKWKTNPNHIDPRKRQRGAVQRYFAFKTLLQLQANQMGYQMGETLDAVYILPMPKSWSGKKKEKMDGLPCKSKPDTDNITKAIKDTLKKEDGDVWWEKISDGGVIIIDDWALDGVRIACYEFFEEKKINPIIHTIENSTPTYFYK